jgi:hypothetical protein
MGCIGVLAFAFFRIPQTDVVRIREEKSAPPSKYLFFEKTPAPSAGIPFNQNRVNRMLDVQVVVDTGSYTYDGVTAESYSRMTDAEIEETLTLADRLFAEKTGVHLRLLGIERRSLSGLSNLALSEWARTYIETTANAPEAFVVFSLRDPTWIYGGLARLSLPASSDSGYCSEFMVNQGAIESEYQTTEVQRNAGIAIINWEHKFGSCGYESTFPRRARLSEQPQRGECRNNPEDTCVLQGAGYFQCAALTRERSAKPLFFRASSVVHELIHTLDREQYGHTGEARCRAVMSSDSTYTPLDPRYSEEWFSMCPASFPLISTQIRTCP